ncbi:MAG TPA: hypothetical protein VFQ24_04065 [Terriglobia bacterium]|nr:hypothetical protein [Terriglobia bacterium]
MLASRTGQSDRPAAGGLLVNLARKAFSFPAVLATLLLAGAFMSIGAGVGNVSSDPSAASQFWIRGDAWWHLAIGRQILATHAWPHADVYSFTMPGKPWIAYEWLGEVVMAAAWKAGGLRGLMILLTAFAGAILILLFYYCYQRSRDLTASFVACALLLPLAALSFSVQPQLLGEALLLATLIILERFRQGRPRPLWALPLLFLIWVNSHGTFILGFGALAIYLVGGSLSFRAAGVWSKPWTPAQRRQLGLTILLCGLASLVTPYGIRLAIFPVQFMSLQPISTRIVTEFQPLPLSSFQGVLFVACLLFFCGAILTRRLYCQLPDFLLLAVAAGGTLLHARLIVLFVPVFAPFLAELFVRWLPGRQAQKERTLVNALLMACILAGIVGFFPSKSNLQEVRKLIAPVGAASFLGSRPDIERTYTYYDWGSFLLFDLGPARKVFIDGRLNLYERDTVFSDYLNALSTENGLWTLLRKYDIDSCLVPQGTMQASLLSASPQWKEVYHDRLSVIFVKTQGPVPTRTRAADPCNITKTKGSV